MGCAFSCQNEEEDKDGDDVNIVNAGPTRSPQVRRSRSRSRTPSRNRRPSSHNQAHNINEVSVAIRNENVSRPTNSSNINEHFEDKNINLGTTGIVLFPEALQDEKVTDLPFKTPKAQFVINLFSKYSKNKRMTLRVKHIKEVSNPYLWAMYNLKKEEMISREGHVDELFLFHGTKRQNINSIYLNNLNWRLSGSATGNRFGQGVSLSPKATYASHYCDKSLPVKVMFLMKVLFSKAVIGTPDMIIPKEKQNNQTVYYDTSIKEDCSVVVKYCDNEFYPAYIIYFEFV